MNFRGIATMMGDGPEAEANTDLIIAAPSMYAALHAALAGDPGWQDKAKDALRLADKFESDLEKSE